MNKINEPVLGIDTGGTHVKCGLVMPSGEIHAPRIFSTPDLIAAHGFPDFLLEPVSTYMSLFPSLNKVGIGIPGYLSADRSAVIEMPNVEGIYPLALKERLRSAFPEADIRLKNDANCAVLGEHSYGACSGRDCLLITMGTGIGSGAVINGRLFTGGGGNGMELGHMLDGLGRSAEQLIGKQGILSEAARLKHPAATGREGSFTALTKAAASGDPLAMEVFEYVGSVLGLMIHNTIRLLDITTVFIGGGLSVAFDYFYPALFRYLTENLIPYYRQRLVVTRASLGNDAGTIGAALLHNAVL